MAGVEAKNGLIIDTAPLIANGGEWKQDRDAEAVARLIQNNARTILGIDLEREGLRYIEAGRTKLGVDGDGLRGNFKALKLSVASTVIAIKNGMGWEQSSSQIRYISAASYIDTVRKIIKKAQSRHEMRRSQVPDTDQSLRDLQKLEGKMTARLNKFAKHRLTRGARREVDLLRQLFLMDGGQRRPFLAKFTTYNGTNNLMRALVSYEQSHA